MMNGSGALLWLATIITVFSIPLVMYVILMRLVGRIATRTVVTILVVDSIFWGMAIYFWCVFGFPS